jgi:uncharacterized membrane protein
VTDQQLEQTIGNLLRAGVLLSAAVVFSGGVWLLIECAGTHADYRQFHPPAAVLRSPLKVAAGLAHPNPQDLIQFGLLLLIATPVARVILSLAVFAFQHDRMYVVITLIVLLVLAYSLAVPH